MEEDMSPPLPSSLASTTAVSLNPSPLRPSSPNSTSFPANPREQVQSFSVHFASMYHSVFPPLSSLPSSLSFTPSPCSSADDDHNQDHSSVTSCTTTDDVLVQARLILEHRALREHHDLCLSRFRDLIKEADYLRRENAQLRLANAELVKLLSSVTAIDDLFATPNSHIRSPLTDDNQRVMIGGGVWEGQNVEEVSYDTISPTSVIRSNQFEGRDLQRVALPKSISVRSIGYVKASQLGAKFDGHDRSATRPNVPNPLNIESHRVCVPASGGGSGKREEEAMELEVYNQGMTKTELCNKWQETGGCPYGDHCRFAHGLEELRPVMRHPRYKTEMCRMVLAGEKCPYGHRCHFRHSPSERERL